MTQWLPLPIVRVMLCLGQLLVVLVCRRYRKSTPFVAGCTERAGGDHKDLALKTWK